MSYLGKSNRIGSCHVGLVMKLNHPMRPNSYCIRPSQILVQCWNLLRGLKTLCGYFSDTP